MRVSTRSLFALTIVGAVVALHACGGEKGAESLPPPAASVAPAPSGPRKEGPPPGAASVDPSVSSPLTCAFLDGDAGLALEIEPACKACVVEKCCGPITKCFGAPADAGLPGVDGGNRSACALFGDCEMACFAGSDAGDVRAACEDACRAKYGEEAANAWIASDSCLYGPTPNGCACP